ncbi:MAG: hypothetical protein P8P74_13435 [Crocinitomicaceae bacterium]|nr:hypothetical protein [Crocinitomicaceae bacterium]
MKQYLLLVLAFIFVDASFAQSTYESPHVKDGKTIQFKIPKGFYKVDDSDFEGNSLFTTREGMDYSTVSTDRETLGMLAVFHEPIDEMSPEGMLEDLQTELIEENPDVVVMIEPTITEEKGREFVIAAFKGDIEEEKMGGIFFSLTTFGDYNILIAYYALEGVEKPLDFKRFKSILTSWKVVDTDKEDAFEEMNEAEYAAFEDEMEYEDYAVYFPNDLFETKLTYYDVLPDFGGDWDDYIDESGHLLSMFNYKEDNGFIKLFSGGLASEYPSEEEMASAIQKAMDWTKTMTLVFNTQFSNEDHVFRLYTISGGGTMSSVYTTVVGDELVFFVVDGGSNPVDDFKPAVRDFMLTMWIDYFDQETEPVEEK